ncbi:DUF3575 domain-containing protein [Legionella sp. MW5194]|uniref:DUF3575 domain-containing protein n=1 Tax=Legionella sp. MW5194 TaxID=2662448 RepID=UPI001AF99AF0|nr:DUF3575 domain-containing protein [Legionella sp. MW5194]
MRTQQLKHSILQPGIQWWLERITEGQFAGHHELLGFINFKRLPAQEQANEQK